MPVWSLIRATLGYSSVALLGTFLIRNSGWAPMTLFSVLVGLFVAALAVLVYWAIQRRGEHREELLRNRSLDCYPVSSGCACCGPGPE